MMPRVPPPESRLPDEVDLHEMKTAIIDPEEREQRVIKRRHRPRPGAQYRKDRHRETQQKTLVVDTPREAEPPQELDPGFHSQPTKIINVGAEQEHDRQVEQVEPVEHEELDAALENEETGEQDPEEPEVPTTPARD
jgi:hypothetical protein